MDEKKGYIVEGGDEAAFLRRVLHDLK